MKFLCKYVTIYLQEGVNPMQSLLTTTEFEIIDTIPPVTADTMFYVYTGLAVLALACIGFIIFMWNRGGKRRDKKD